MVLKVENFAKIKNAEVKIDGITVIAGENNTGKSTIGKIFYCIYNCYYDFKEKINTQKELYIQSVFIKYLFDINKSVFSLSSNIEKFQVISKNILNNKDNIMNNTDNMENLKLYIQNQLFSELNIQFEKDNFKLQRITSDISKTFDLNNKDFEEILINQTFDCEFASQINHINSQHSVARIHLKIKDEEFEMNFKNNEILSVNNSMNLYIDSIYIDDPFVLDDINNNFKNNNSPDHTKNLIKKLKEKKSDTSIVDEVILKKQIKKILEQINSVANGSFLNDSGEIKFKVKNLSQPLNINNMSTGLKSFAIINRLIENGYFQSNGLIILDEPEIHLHPEWQLAFAEILVLIQKEFNMNIVITTHSPYFLNAIEVYSKLHNITDKCNYYLAELDKNNTTISYIKDTTKDTSKIYKKLSKPLQKLERIYYNLLDNE